MNISTIFKKVLFDVIDSMLLYKFLKISTAVIAKINLWKENIRYKQMTSTGNGKIEVDRIPNKENVLVKLLV